MKKEKEQEKKEKREMVIRNPDREETDTKQ